LGCVESAASLRPSPSLCTAPIQDKERKKVAVIAVCYEPLPILSALYVISACPSTFVS